ncbi:recombinase family protein [Albidovulum sp.]|jgi:DNA invertase Pin-like site-specific DNA recombinase|uniref:recombinase family protein n=1 Tax=Albidovulum sp. TaxID=1872424 RepID=UPI0039B96F49
MGQVRCAIYTRKSSEEGLEQQFNSLHAQREAYAAYVASQKAEGWVLLPEAYDDGGISGGTLERPAMQRLLTDVDEGRVDQIVVYKIDRLTRSLADFAKIVARLDAAGASFVSVTQSFNTATSMGRLTLNMLLSFAQFEREITAERIRDKIAASKRKGLWMGGNVPLGYRAQGRTLAIDEAEAGVIRQIYALYRAEGSILTVRERMADLGLRTRVRTAPDGRVSGGGPFGRAHLHHILTNPVYAGRIRHRTVVHDGQHPAIISPEEWDAVQRMLAEGAARPRGRAPAAFASPLAGRIFDETGDRLTPSHSRKNGRRLRYYISSRLVNDRSGNHPDAWRLPAPELEQGVIGRLRAWLTAPGQASRFVRDPRADEMQTVATRIDALVADLDGRHAAVLLRALVAAVRIAPGRMEITVAAEALAGRLQVAPDRLDADHLVLAAPFRIRRRGVETRVLLGDRPAEPDRVLIRNLMKARDWFAALTRGESYTEIAAREGVATQRIQQLLPLAFLAPEIVQRIAEGRQPVGLTTEWLITTDLPVRWHDQRVLVARL